MIQATISQFMTRCTRDQGLGRCCVDLEFRDEVFTGDVNVEHGDYQHLESGVKATGMKCRINREEGVMSRVRC